MTGEIVVEPAYVEAERLGFVPTVTTAGRVIHLVDDYLPQALCGIRVAFRAVRDGGYEDMAGCVPCWNKAGERSRTRATTDRPADG